MIPDDACAAIQPLLLPFAAGSLGPPEVADVARHCATCATCAAAAAEWRTLGATATALAARVPPDVAAAGAKRALFATVGRRVPLDLTTAVAGASAPPTPSVAERIAPRWRSAVAVALAALIVFAGFATFALLRGRGAGVATGADCPGGYHASLPADASVTGLAMLSATDGWAVGFRDRSPGPPETLIAHYQHCVWSPVGVAIPAAKLLRVQMLSPTEGWALGAVATPLAVSSPAGVSGAPAGVIYINGALFLLHFHDGQWQPAAAPPNIIARVAFLTLTGPGDGWIATVSSSNNDMLQPTIYGDHLLRLRGGQWSAVPLPFADDGQTIIGGLLSGGDGSLWLMTLVTHASAPVNGESARETLWHLVGAVWTALPLPANRVIYAADVAPNGAGWLLEGQLALSPTGPPTPTIYTQPFDGQALGATTTLLTPADLAGFAMVEGSGLRLSGAASGFATVVGAPISATSSRATTLFTFTLRGGQWTRLPALTLNGVGLVGVGDLTDATSGWTIATANRAPTCATSVPNQSCAARPFGQLVHFTIGGAWVVVGG